MIVAIDGPAASGKSTTARLVAQHSQFEYLDTGAMYRAVTLAVLADEIDLNDVDKLRELLKTISIDLQTNDEGDTIIFLNGRDVSREIRAKRVTDYVSAVSAEPIVREALVHIQRAIGHRHNCVVEGRDIGTVVFPDADLKFFMVADYQTRAQRRQKDLNRLGERRSIEDLIADLKRRDQLDSSRLHSPLTKAVDALEIDTTSLTIKEQVRIILDQIETKQKEIQNNE